MLTLAARVRLERRPERVRRERDGRTLLATGGDDRTVRLWDPATGREVHRTALPHSVNALCPPPDSEPAVGYHHHVTVLYVPPDRGVGGATCQPSG